MECSPLLGPLLTPIFAESPKIGKPSYLCTNPANYPDQDERVAAFSAGSVSAVTISKVKVDPCPTVLSLNFKSPPNS